MKFFRSMDVSVVPANTVIYHILVDSYCKNQKVYASIDLFNVIQKQYILPNATIYTSIFKVLRIITCLIKLSSLWKRRVHRDANQNVTMDVLTGWLTAISETD
ncbi:pentatricopeptide repeat-containing protein At1g63150-like [Zingiber officinale]|uniref:pentatricopeptide repeat-containing protein At1g63150-like n=1 Tax=Zingiber officinale TaxID=94328 RepID=UPI001C4D7B96|nr:pentatricopeptide repeat-containing protein At1g63150-like [Zingiber officinale]